VTARLLSRLVHARAIRFSTLTRLCQALDCQPGDLLSHNSTGSQAEPQPD
jgi:DNA-binding Xre family transcriptional regulator